MISAGTSTVRPTESVKEAEPSSGWAGVDTAGAGSAEGPSVGAGPPQAASPRSILRARRVQSSFFMVSSLLFFIWYLAGLEPEQADGLVYREIPRKFRVVPPLKAALQGLGGQLRRIVPAVCAEKDRRVLQGAEGLAHIQL